MSITVSATTVNNLETRGLQYCFLRIYCLSGFTDTDSHYYEPGRLGSSQFFLSSRCTIANGVISVPAVTHPQPVSSNLNIRFVAGFFDYRGRLLAVFENNYLLPTLLGSPITWQQIREFTNGATTNIGPLNGVSIMGSVGNIVFANSNGVTFGGNNSTITASAAGGGGGGSPLTVSAGTSSGSLNSIVFGDSNGISWGLSGSTLTGTARTNYAGSNGAITGGSITVNTSGVSINLPAYLTTADLSQNSSKYAGINGAITGGSLTVNTSGVSINLPAYLTTAALSQDSSKYAGTNGAITGGSITVNTSGVSINLPAYLTTAALSQDSSKYAGTNGAITGGSITVNTSGVSVNLPAYLTTADLSANSSKYFQNWKLSGNTAGTTSSAQGTDFWLAGGNNITLSGSSNTISFSIGNYITTADLSQNSSKYVQNWKLTGNTAGTTSSAQGTDLWISGGNSLTVSGNSNTIVLSVGNYITTADLSQNSSKYVQNWKLTGNTAGTTSSAQGTDIWYSGGNSITVSGNSNTIVFSVGNYLTTAALSGDTSKYMQNWKLTGNTAGTTSSAEGTDLWFGGANGVTVSGSNNTISIAGPPHLSYFRFEDPNNTVTSAFSQSTSYFAPFELDWNYSYDRMRVVASGSCGASSTQATTGNTSLSMSAVTSQNIVIYSRGTGANSQSLQFLTSTQALDKCQMTISYAANSTQYSVSLRFTLGNTSFTKDYSISSGTINWHTSHLTDLTGMKFLDIPLGISLPPNQYWVGYGRSTTIATQANSVSEATRMAVSHNSMIAISMNTLALGMLGSDTNSSVAWKPGFGSFTTGGAAGTTNSLDISKVSSNSSNNAMYLQLMRIA